MKACRYCRSDDIPDAATHCKHCGKRLKPSQAPLIVILLVIVAAILWALIAWAQTNSARESARSQARIEIDSLKAVHCTPDIAEEFDEVNTRKFEDELDRSPLDLEEKESLKAAFANGMELSGCGFSARNQPVLHAKHR